MLFNSYGFIFLFLPCVLLVFSLAVRWQKWSVAIGWLVSTSLFFYGYWNPRYLVLILISIFSNYVIGYAITGLIERNNKQYLAKAVFIAGVLVNLLAIAYYKYQGFFISNANAAFELFSTKLGFDTNFSLTVPKVALPLAISFFTFQQIAYLVDVYQGKVSGKNGFLKYCLFITFFPQLIAGPIVHYQEIIPQFSFQKNPRINTESLAIGISIFSVGLFKKFLADAIAMHGNPIFTLALRGETLSFFEAWYGALAYTLQLYFDFSGYSDMAIGLGNMFGIRLPLNFFSPYKAVSIIDFWRRWHMTLSKFLRDYRYIPLGGSRKGKTRKYINLLVTMLLGGLWHGAGWTFVLWGGLHGIYLIINHTWRALMQKLGLIQVLEQTWMQFCGRTLTFLAVVISWVLFRAENLSAASAMFQSMVGLNGMLPSPPVRIRAYIDLFSPNQVINMPGIYLLVALLIITWAFPNTQQIFEKYDPTTLTYDIRSHVNRVFASIRWHPSMAWILITCTMNLASLSALASISSEFLYFRF